MQRHGSYVVVWDSAFRTRLLTSLGVLNLIDMAVKKHAKLEREDAQARRQSVSGKHARKSWRVVRHYTQRKGPAPKLRSLREVAFDELPTRTKRSMYDKLAW